MNETRKPHERTREARCREVMPRRTLRSERPSAEQLLPVATLPSQLGAAVLLPGAKRMKREHLDGMFAMWCGKSAVPENLTKRRCAQR